jgi:hypothetical protein
VFLWATLLCSYLLISWNKYKKMFMKLWLSVDGQVLERPWSVWHLNWPLKDERKSIEVIINGPYALSFWFTKIVPVYFITFPGKWTQLLYCNCILFIFIFKILFTGRCSTKWSLTFLIFYWSLHTCLSLVNAFLSSISVLLPFL